MDKDSSRREQQQCSIKLRAQQITNCKVVGMIVDRRQQNTDSKREQDIIDFDDSGFSVCNGLLPELSAP